MDYLHHTDTEIADILSTVRHVAIVGASLNDDKPSHWVAGFLLGKGYTIYPVNPAYAGQTLLGQTIYSRLSDIPEHVDMIDVFRRSEHFAGVVDEVLKLPDLPKAIWGQLGVRDDKAAEKAEAAGIKVIMDRSLVSEYAMVYGRSHGQAA